ncbi:MAG: DUF2490 domain-containing protein [Rikenellaceae bacterium]
MSIKHIITTTLLLLSTALSSQAKGTADEIEVKYKYRFGADFQIKLAKGLKLNLEPEFRFNEGYDKLVLSSSLSYKTFGCIYWGATYRLDVDRQESATTTTSVGYNSGLFGTGEYESELFHRYAFDVTYKEKFGRFTPSFRLRYNNFADESIDDERFMRYRAKVDYNIRKCRITPTASIEAFQQLGDGASGAILYKMRYSTGFDLKINKQSSINFDYKFELHCLEYQNNNIFSVGYGHKF